MVYSKNESSIWLRWLPPYPPYGVLQDYLLEYSCHNCKRSETKNLVVAKENCDLWQEYHCAEINMLQEHIKYTIMVKNNRNTMFSYLDR